MKILPTLIALFVGASIAGAEESTFDSVLGRETVEKIVNEIVDEVRTQKNEFTKVIVERDLTEEVVTLAGKSKVTTRELQDRDFAAKRLQGGLTIFFHNYRDFVAREETNFKSLVLGLPKLNDFFDWLKTAEGCGKIPCSIPPCCGDCDGCKRKE
jgi:hypothetical protein